MSLHREIQPIVLPQRSKSLCAAGLANQLLCRSQTALGADQLEESGGIVAALFFRRGIDIDHFLLKACLIYLIVVALLLLNSFLKSVYEISNEHESLRNRPLKGIYQMINILAIGVGIILIISVLIDKDATSILAGLGASAAILMLIFKDSILGLVAGVQLSANDMLRPGDWITMPKYGADGDVIEVTLTYDSTIRVGERFVPKLAGYARDGRKTHQAFHQYRPEYHPFLYG